MNKLYYVVYAPGVDNDDIEIMNISDDEFKRIATEQENVFSQEDFVCCWNDETLPVIDSYLRIL